jgi:hypothetical protein
LAGAGVGEVLLVAAGVDGAALRGGGALRPQRAVGAGVAERREAVPVAVTPDRVVTSFGQLAVSSSRSMVKVALVNMPSRVTGGRVLYRSMTPWSSRCWKNSPLPEALSPQHPPIPAAYRHRTS